MKKYFCDVCGDEITRVNKFENNVILVKKYRIVLALDKPVSDDDCVCLFCVLHEIAKLDKLDRPTAARRHSSEQRL